MLPSGNKTQRHLATAIRLTALGAQLSISALVALLTADLASQLELRNPGLIFGVTGGTVALVTGRSLHRFFRAFD
jgi:hypothetical protein